MLADTYCQVDLRWAHSITQFLKLPDLEAMPELDEEPAVTLFHILCCRLAHGLRILTPARCSCVQIVGSCTKLRPACTLLQEFQRVRRHYAPCCAAAAQAASMQIFGCISTLGLEDECRQSIKWGYEHIHSLFGVSLGDHDALVDAAHQKDVWRVAADVVVCCSIGNSADGSAALGRCP